MARIPFPDLDKSSPEVREMLSRLPAPVGIFNMIAHAETSLKPLMKLGGTFLGKLKLDPLLRELVILHAVKIEGATTNGCSMCRSCSRLAARRPR